MTETIIMVGMAEVKATRSPSETLASLGLGSCIGVCAFDATTRVAGLAHVVLPETLKTGTASERGKFADTAVPMLLEEMGKAGANRLHIRAAIVGGAQIFGGGQSGLKLDIGARNAAAVREGLKKENVPLVAADVGGNYGRTVHLSLPNGRVWVKTIGHSEKELVILGNVR
ncbi:MAG: chemotaxis protein CheD [Armatimonadetes bacterium]|nr:chemotaxis protein CheD [Armatimonadota bacterium]